MCSEGGKVALASVFILLLSTPPRQDAASGQGWVNRPETLSYGCGLKVKLAGSLWPGSWLSVDASVNGGGAPTADDPSSHVPSKWKAEAMITFSACGFPLCFCICSCLTCPCQLPMSLLPRQQSREPDIGRVVCESGAGPRAQI